MSVADLQRMIDGAKIFRLDEGTADSSERTERTLRLQTLDEYDVRPTVTWFVRDLIPAQSLCVVFGAPKSGKTYTVTDMAMHAAHGMHWHGRTVPRGLRIAYLAGEGHSGLRVRLHAWRAHHVATLKGDYRVLAEALPLVERQAEVIQLLRTYTPDLIILDTANAYYGVADENSTQDMTAFVATLRRLRDELRCAVIVIHHTGLGDQTRERGSSVLRAAADVIVQVARDESGSGLVGVQVISARDMEPWTEALSLRLSSITTDWADDEGQPIRTCVVERADQSVTLPGREKRVSPAQTAVLSAVMSLSSQVTTDGLLSRPDIIKHAMKAGTPRASAYRAVRELAPRMGWQYVEPNSLRVVRQP